MSQAVPDTYTSARTPWSFVALLGAITAVGPLSIDMYLPSLPTIAHDLGTTAQATQASVTVFLAGMACGQLFYGPASDRFGRRGPILIGFAVFIAGSVACVFAQNAATLLIARFAQSLGACAGSVIVRAIVRDHFNKQDSARFFSLLALIMGAAPILAPLAGSVLLGPIGWRGIFAVLTAFGVVLLGLIFFRLRESRSEAQARHARSEHPLRAYLTLLGERRVMGYIAAGSLNGAILFTYLSSSSSVLMGVYGVSPKQFAVLIALNAAGLIGGAQLNRRLLRRFTTDQVLGRASLGTCAAAFVLAADTWTGAGGLLGILIPLFVTIASGSLIQANSIAGALAADPLRTGSISALFGAIAFGTGALAGSVAAALYDFSALPMALTIVVSSMGCVFATRVLALRVSSPAV